MSTAVAKIKPKPFIHVKYNCYYCEREHSFVCNCGHRHDEHSQFGGCQIPGCDCSKYDQTRQRMWGESKEEFDNRTLLSKRRP